MKAAIGAGIVSVVLTAQSVAVGADKPVSLENYVRRTRNPQTALFEIRAECTVEDGQQVPPFQIELACDKVQRGYRSTTTSQGLAVSYNVRFLGEEGVVWSAAEGNIDRIDQYKTRKAPRGKCPVLQRMGTVMFLVDAMFGYARLETETTLTRANSPLGKQDDLDWFEVSRPAGDDTGLFYATMASEALASRMWVGLSPKTGWPVKQVWKTRREKVKGQVTLIFTVTRVDTKPDLRAVFELPPNVKAKLNKKN
jgi:hypothetical protein